MSCCSIKWCGRNTRISNAKKDGITFHRFPKNPERKSKWIDACSRGDAWFPSVTAVVCSRHFSEDMFYQIKERRRLMDTATPILYLPVLASNSPKSPTNTDDDCMRSPLQKQDSDILEDSLPADCPTKKYLCTRIVELQKTLESKDRIIKKVCESNRSLKKQIKMLKSLMKKEDCITDVRFCDLYPKVELKS